LIEQFGRIYSRDRTDMKIVFVNRFFYPDESATSRLTSSLAFALAKAGWTVHVVTGRRFHNRDWLPLAGDEVAGVAVHRIWSSSFTSTRLFGQGLEYLTFHASAWWHIRRLARSRVVVVACTDPPLLSITAMLAVARSDAVLVNWIHDLFPEAAIQLGLLDSRRFLARLLCRMRDVSLRTAHWNVVPTWRMAEPLLKRGMSPSALSIIHYWSDGETIRPVERACNPLLREWGLEDKFVVGYSGNLGRVHEFATILDAAESLRNQRDIVFLFIGDGHRRDWVESEARRRGLENVIMKPLQPRERLAESLSVPELHLVSLLPRLEACSVPSKLYGILAAGRPTLFVGDLDGEVARIITEGCCGAAVPIGDGHSLARRITELAGSATLRRRMGENARLLFDTTFHQEIGIDKWRRRLTDASLSGEMPRTAAPIGKLRGLVSRMGALIR
jgi:colanic acid biosynthesis glycosyl transferase WcaI